MRLRENGEIDIEISRVIYVCKELPMPTYRFGHWINKLNNSLCQHCRMGKNESQKACAHANAYCMLSGSPCQSENLMNHKVAFLRLTCTQHKMTLTCGQSGMYISHDVERQGKKREVCMLSVVPLPNQVLSVFIFKHTIVEIPNGMETPFLNFRSSVGRN